MRLKNDGLYVSKCGWEFVCVATSTHHRKQEKILSLNLPVQGMVHCKKAEEGVLPVLDLIPCPHRQHLEQAHKQRQQQQRQDGGWNYEQSKSRPVVNQSTRWGTDVCCAKRLIHVVGGGAKRMGTNAIWSVVQRKQTRSPQTHKVYTSAPGFQIKSTQAVATVSVGFAPANSKHSTSTLCTRYTISVGLFNVVQVRRTSVQQRKGDGHTMSQVTCFLCYGSSHRKTTGRPWSKTARAACIA